MFYKHSDIAGNRPNRLQECYIQEAVYHKAIIIILLSFVCRLLSTSNMAPTVIKQCQTSSYHPPVVALYLAENDLGPRYPYVLRVTFKL